MPDPGHAVGRSAAIRLTLAVMVSAAFMGCAQDYRPQYVMPSKPAGEVATLVAEYNVLSSFSIDEVDGARVVRPPFSANYAVKLVPGRRRITVVGAAGNTQARWTFVHDFVAGHRYAISAGDAFTQAGLKLTDQTTHTSKILD